MSKDLVIKSEVDGEKLELTLTDREVQAGVSVCHINNVDSVFCMKGATGHAQFFHSERNAAATQDQEKFENCFLIKAEDLLKHAEKHKIMPKFMLVEQEEEQEAEKEGGKKPPPLKS